MNNQSKIAYDKMDIKLWLQRLTKDIIDKYLYKRYKLIQNLNVNKCNSLVLTYCIKQM